MSNLHDLDAARAATALGASAASAAAQQPIPSIAPVLDVQDLRISYRDEGRNWQPVVHGVSLQIRPGEVLALVGESGSGKSTTSQAIIGLLAENGRVDGGRIQLNGQDISGWSQKRLDSIRGSVVSLIPQDPVASLNPVRTIGDQVGEIVQLHQRMPRKAREQLVEHLLDRVGISHPSVRARQYPHELSGGMRQRVLIATAIALKPALIIADEPTSALDVTVQRRILDLIDELRRESQTAVLLVTHDLGVAADRSDRLVVLQHGRVQESGATADVLQAPSNRYTQQLLADAPARQPVWRSAQPVAAVQGAAAQQGQAHVQEDAPLVQVEGVSHAFAVRGQKQPLHVLRHVGFALRRGQTHALVGESGSGKTTTIRAVMGLLTPDVGEITVKGQSLRHLKGEALRQLRRDIQLVYQNPYRSLDPRQTVFEIIEEPLRNYEKVDAAERRRRVEALHARVGLAPALLQRRPDALSGGQRQRVAIARALILKPQILVLDEAVSALDVTVQAQILGLLDELQRELGLSYLFISHDLAVVARIADTVTVLQQGQVVEEGPIRAVFEHPQHPYTQELIDAIPGKKGLSHGRLDTDNGAAAFAEFEAQPQAFGLLQQAS